MRFIALTKISFLTDRLILILLMLFLLPQASADTISRKPLHPKTEIASGDKAAVVILVPADKAYRELGSTLADKIAERTGVRIEVADASDFVTASPRAVKDEKLDRHFILLGQFWNNPVLERLYAGYYDPTDLSYPGPGGWELRTVCAPFKYGHNCIVATGSDIDGCRRAARELSKLIQVIDNSVLLPFLHTIVLSSEAEKNKAQYRAKVDPLYEEIDRYVVFRHPEAKSWWGEDPRNLLVWNYRNLAAASVFGLHFWLEGDQQDAEAFKRIVFGCREQVDQIAELYKEGRPDLMDYSGGSLTVVWDLIEESGAFTDEERRQITDFVYQMAYLNRDAYYVIKCKDIPLDKISIGNRHEMAGMMWMDLISTYMLRNCELTEDQQRLASDLHAHSRKFLQRHSQTPFVSDRLHQIADEGQLVSCWSQMVGSDDMVESGSLATLSDYLVSSHCNLGYAAATHGAGTKVGALGPGILSVADYMLPTYGYASFLQGLKQTGGFSNFLFYIHGIAGDLPYYTWRMPCVGSTQQLHDRMAGVTVTPIGEPFYKKLGPTYTWGQPESTYTTYASDKYPYEMTWKRITLRSGFKPEDQYLVMDGVQGWDWWKDYDKVNAVAHYDDLGEELLRPSVPKWYQSRLDMNSLMASNGKPGWKKSMTGGLVLAIDQKDYAMLSSLDRNVSGLMWTRHIFWKKNAWFAFASEVKSRTNDDYALVETWLAMNPFRMEGSEAISRANNVTLHILTTPDRKLEIFDGVVPGDGLRHKLTKRLTMGRPFIMWTLMYARSPERPTAWNIRQLDSCASLIYSDRGEKIVAFVDSLTLGDTRVLGDTGLVSHDRLIVSGCKEITLKGRVIWSSAQGNTIAWDLQTNELEEGKSGLGIWQSIELSALKSQRNAVAQALHTVISKAGTKRHHSVEPKVDPTAAENTLPVEYVRLPTPVSLASSDLDGDGNDDLLLYDDKLQPRFADVGVGTEDLTSYQRQWRSSLEVGGTLICPPVAVGFDGDGHRDIALAAGKMLSVYRQDGSLRWKEEQGGGIFALTAGDMNGDDRDELGLGLTNWGKVVDHTGNTLVDHQAWGYQGIAGAFSDVDSDGDMEFLSLSQSGVNIFSIDQPRKELVFPSFISSDPCRVWLMDPEDQGYPNCYVGGGNTDLACFDLKNLKRKWVVEMPLGPSDVALCDVDGDGNPEFVCGSLDGYLSVVGLDGKFKCSKALTDGIVSLAVVPAQSGQDVKLIAGMVSGRLLMIGSKLEVLRQVRIGDKPVRHVAILNRREKCPVILAADDTGSAIRMEFK